MLIQPSHHVTEVLFSGVAGLSIPEYIRLYSGPGVLRLSEDRKANVTCDTFEVRFLAENSTTKKKNTLYRVPRRTEGSIPRFGELRFVELRFAFMLFASQRVDTPEGNHRLLVRYPLLLNV